MKKRSAAKTSKAARTAKKSSQLSKREMRLISGGVAKVTVEII